MNINAWYNEKPIDAMLHIERQRCEFLLTKFTGQRIAFLSEFLPYQELIHHGFRETLLISHQVKKWLPQIVCANYDELPLDSDYLNCSVLLHIFDFSHFVDEVIAELWRVTAAEGIVIIFGFNPYPLFGQMRLLKQLANQQQLKRAIPPNVLRPKLMHQGFELLEFGTIIHRLASSNINLFHKLKFLDIVGDICWTDSGAIYY
ncbi:MAG: hypothetical protein AAGG80_02550 [Pseudomonadota bacterium]